MYFECIKSFQLDGGSFPIMEGEKFRLVDKDELLFESIEGFSINPKREFYFTNKQLADNFKFLYV